MPYLSRYHLRQQQAYALLGPMCASLRELEHRALHFVDRVNLEAADQATVRQAHDAIAAARAEVERLWRSSDAKRDG